MGEYESDYVGLNGFFCFWCGVGSRCTHPVDRAPAVEGEAVLSPMAGPVCDVSGVLDREDPG